MFRLLEKLLEQDKDSFRSLFQPLSPEEFVRRRLEVGKCTQNPDGTWSCKGDVDLSNLGLEKLPVKFKRVEGNFDISHNNLTTLEGSPEYVGGEFDCSWNKLPTLKGAPSRVEGFFVGRGNNFTSLRGAPKYVGDSLFLQDNKLPTLKGAPEYVGGSIHCQDNKLISLEGIGEVRGIIYTARNSSRLKDLKQTVPPAMRKKVRSDYIGVPILGF